MEKRIIYHNNYSDKKSSDPIHRGSSYRRATPLNHIPYKSYNIKYIVTKSMESSLSYSVTRNWRISFFFWYDVDSGGQSVNNYTILRNHTQCVVKHERAANNKRVQKFWSVVVDVRRTRGFCIKSVCPTTRNIVIILIRVPFDKGTRS